MKRLVSILLALALLAGAAPAAPRVAKPGDSLVLAKGDRGTVTPPGLRIWVKSLESGKRAQLVVIDGKVLHDLDLQQGGARLVGDWAVTLPVVSRACLVVVWFRPPADQAAAVIAQYGWHPDGSSPTSIPLEVPTKLDGLPFHHYQLASHAIRMDLSAAAGQKIDVRRWRLREKTRSGAAIYAYMAHLGPRIVGAWIATDAPVAPGIAPLSSHGPEKW